MTKKTTLCFGLALLAMCGYALGGVPPAAVQTFGDAHYLGNAHWTLGTGTFCPAGVDCLSAQSGCATDDTIARSAYVGTFLVTQSDGWDCVEPNEPQSCDDGNDLTAIAVFNGDAVSGGKCALRFHNAQNFIGHAVTYNVRVLKNTGREGSDPGAEGVFNGTNAFGPFTGADIATVLTEARSGQTSKLAWAGGSVSVPSLEAGFTGPSLHAPVTGEDTSCGAPPYTSFDRSFDVPLVRPDGVQANLRHFVDWGVSYATRQYLCASGAAPADVGTTNIANPLYVAIYVSLGGGDASLERLQDGLAVDNLISLHGDCDFAGDPVQHETTFIELVCGGETVIEPAG